MVIEGLKMKSAKFNKNQSSEMSTGYHTLKERRKSYYHGKYDRELMSVVVLLTLVMVYILRQSL